MIDGLDGTGKTTQASIIYQKLIERDGAKVKQISFPDYDNPSSTLVKMYLNGDIKEKASDINAYAASSFYATDRYISYKKYWEEYYNDGYTILTARYVSSNGIHQMVKLDKSEWEEYLAWLADYEYEKLGLPKPYKTIFLNLPRRFADKLIDSRYNNDSTKKDIHEKDIEYLKRCEEATLFVADRMGFCVIDCTKDDKLCSIEEITDMILKELEDV